MMLEKRLELWKKERDFGFNYGIKPRKKLSIVFRMFLFFIRLKT